MTSEDLIASAIHFLNTREEYGEALTAFDNFVSLNNPTIEEISDFIDHELALYFVD